jgi:hypothetical protein
MWQPVILQLVDQEILRGDLETLPNPDDQFMILHNPRQPDGKKLGFVEEGVEKILVPWHQILVVQLLPDAGNSEPISFVRE